MADLTFSARKDGDRYGTGDYALLRLTLWIASEEASGGDADLEAGEGVVYRPVSNDKNTAEWEGIASVSFSASNDADQVLREALHPDRSRYLRALRRPGRRGPLFPRLHRRARGRLHFPRHADPL